jgi:lipopolysaccharide transport protein LptA
MDESFRRWLIFGPALTVCSALAAQDGQGTSEIAFDCKSGFEIDGNSNLIHCIQPQITQGELKIEADDAFAADYEFDDRSEMRFTGNVRITMQRGQIDAASAVFTFENNQLAHGDLVGTPATFSVARIESGREPVQGSANKITLDYGARTLRMTEAVRVRRDQFSFQGCDIVFEFDNERVANGPTDCGEDYSIRIAPKNPPEGAPDNKPATSP